MGAYQPPRYCQACGAPLQFDRYYYHCSRCGKLFLPAQPLSMSRTSGWYGSWPFKDGAYDPHQLERLLVLTACNLWPLELVQIVNEVMARAMQIVTDNAVYVHHTDFATMDASIQWDYLHPYFYAMWAVALALRALVLFRREIWLKWISILLSVLAMARILVLTLNLPPSIGPSLTLCGAVSIAIECWFASLLYRDISFERESVN